MCEVFDSSLVELLEELGGASMSVPDCYADHSLIRGRIFYTLPVGLLREVERAVGRDAFAQDLVEMEYALAEQLDPVPTLVGFDRGQAIEYALLTSAAVPLPQASDDWLKRLNFDRVTYAAFCKKVAQQIGSYPAALRGYVGWLRTNPDFLDGRDQLFEKWPDQLAEHGIPQAGPTFFGGIPYEKLFYPVQRSTMLDFLNDFDSFYTRWRLRHLKTRDLPEPLAPQIPLNTPLALLSHMREGGVSLYQPDTMPVPPRDRLRNVLEDTRLARANDHLSEWIRIIRRSRRNDQAIALFGQVLSVHHYWTTLEDRHPRLFGGNIGRLQEAFSRFLCVSTDAVDKYRQRIRRRRGPRHTGAS